jgi:hypothetical protein
VVGVAPETLRMRLIAYPSWDMKGNGVKAYDGPVLGAWAGGNPAKTSVLKAERANRTAYLVALACGT